MVGTILDPLAKAFQEVKDRLGKVVNRENVRDFVNGMVHSYNPAIPDSFPQYLGQTFVRFVAGASLPPVAEALGYGPVTGSLGADMLIGVVVLGTIIPLVYNLPQWEYERCKRYRGAVNESLYCRVVNAIAEYVKKFAREKNKE